MLSLGPTWELFKQNRMDETDHAFYLIWFKASTWTRQNRSQQCTALIPKANTHRTSLALGGTTSREVSVRAQSSWLPVSREFWLQETLLYTDAGYCQQGDPCFKKQHLTDLTINLKLGRSQGLGIYFTTDKGPSVSNLPFWEASSCVFLWILINSFNR